MKLLIKIVSVSIQILDHQLLIVTHNHLTIPMKLLELSVIFFYIFNNLQYSLYCVTNLYDVIACLVVILIL